MAGVNAFAVPPPLVAARKKRRTEGAVAAEAKDVDGYHAFFTTREYAQFSQFGGEPETQRYQQEQRLRRTLLSSGAEEAAHDSRQKTKADPMSKLKSVHIMVLLEDLMTKRFPDANDQVALAANGRRRLSALSIEQHEAYLALVRKRTEAHSVSAQRHVLTGVVGPDLILTLLTCGDSAVCPRSSRCRRMKRRSCVRWKSKFATSRWVLCITQSVFPALQSLFVDDLVNYGCNTSWSRRTSFDSSSKPRPLCRRRTSHACPHLLLDG